MNGWLAFLRHALAYAHRGLLGGLVQTSGLASLRLGLRVLTGSFRYCEESFRASSRWDYHRPRFCAVPPRFQIACAMTSLFSLGGRASLRAAPHQPLTYIRRDRVTALAIARASLRAAPQRIKN